MSTHSAFGWMLVKVEDHAALVRDREEAREQLKTEMKRYDAIVPSLRADIQALTENLAKATSEKGILAAQLTKAQADLKDMAARLELKTAEQKQTHDDLLMTRKLLFGVPDMLPRGVAEQVDWELMGIPDPTAERK